MSNKTDHLATERRDFIKHVATGAAALGLTMLTPPLKLSAAATNGNVSDADEWFNQLDKKGKHRIIFDAVTPNGMFPFAWPKIYQLTNGATGTDEKETGVVVVLRHETIPYAMQSSLWEKYKFGEFFKIDDPKTQKPSTRNMFWQPAPGDFKVPGVGEVEIGINQLQDHGIMFCVCNMAMTVLSAAAAQSMNMDATTVYNDWKSGVLPGIQIVPSGVWAVGRGQEHGCAYCYAS
ncbi:MAG TPA: twin-arginine translocation signal domain-containing protein [Chitinophagaceae bacterium]|nr:twin-arginine translocation signal domain-containing protein [Chitinophagaceae bacterium]